MDTIPFISICIPAYKRIDFLERLLNSIAEQTFIDFEVIIMDDSRDLSVEDLVKVYAGKFSITYKKNKEVLGTPENWNEAIRYATGKWIKLMHDDDWFAHPGSLQVYYECIEKNPESFFFFSAYKNIYFEKNTDEEIYLNSIWRKRLLKNPAILFSRNVIGPPSVMIHKSERNVLYDRQLKWLVDIDFYIRVLKKNRANYINKPLVNVGISNEQVTQDCFRLRPIEIPEAFYLLNKIGTKNLKNLLVYDAWWRLIRNLEIRKKEEIIESGYPGKIPSSILSMINWQRRIPFSILKIGPFSKILMFLNYIFNFNRIGK